MLSAIEEKILTKILVTGLFLVSVIVTTQGLTDPVNIPKLLCLGIFSFATLGLIVCARVNLWRSRELLIIFFFIFFSTVAVIRSESPFSQNFYGSYGRNNGFIAYLFLSIFFIAGTLLTKRNHYLAILKALLFAGYVNLIYCLWVILFGDFIPWSNPYGNILGTFGNPNFIGAFLGIFFGVLVSMGLGKETSNKFKLSLIPLLPLTIFEIIKSQAIQGRVLAALGLGIVLFFFIKSKYGNVILYSYSILAITVGGFALAGAFQKGPLTELIYKTSVSLRGQYWLAAWNTGKSHPFSGVGMDAFGDWYRRSRDLRAIELPGVNTVVNTAHNVPLDIFAFGGWPLFVSYFLLIGLSLKSLIVIAKRMKEFDSVGVALITSWVCYQIQSLISINQIGLAIWGWALSGSLIGYERFLKTTQDSTNLAADKTIKRSQSKSQVEARSTMFASIFGLAGLLIALPPITSDAALSSAQESRDANKLAATLDGSYFNPQNVTKYGLSIQAFEGSGLFDMSHKYALQAVAWNPESYDLWSYLYQIKKSSAEEKAMALENMKRLDPLNPDLLFAK